MEISNYYDGKNILTKDHGSEDYTRISPSLLAKFFTSPREWWGQVMLGEEGFTGNTGTILGSIIHHFAELAANKVKPIDPDTDVSEYLDKQTIEYDRNVVEENWRDMSNLLIEEHILNTRFHSTEKFIFHKILEGIYVAGTYDAIVYLGNELVLRDYKSTSKKPTGISYEYRTQIHIYAWLLRQLGINIAYVELTYVTQPTKTLPARTFNFREPFTEEDYKTIDDKLHLVADSIKLWKEHPELRYILAQDYRLKLPEKPKLFKN